jgi:hypothetical protein
LALLQNEFGIGPDDLVDRSYVDLLIEKTTQVQPVHSE